MPHSGLNKVKSINILFMEIVSRYDIDSNTYYDVVSTIHISSDKKLKEILIQRDNEISCNFSLW